jgi:hypothetical protein
MAAVRTFPIRYGVFRPFLTVVGAGPAFSRVAIEGDHLRVRMGWTFRADVPLSSVRGAKNFSGLAGGIGVHGWRGTWLVNGGIRGIVEIAIDPPARARVFGIPVRLKVLQVSVQSPEELITALSR